MKSWEGPINYISHHDVPKLALISTKLRIVSNSSLSNNNSGVSYNDCLPKGPNSLVPLIEALATWRQYPRCNGFPDDWWRERTNMTSIIYCSTSLLNKRYISFISIISEILPNISTSSIRFLQILSRCFTDFQAYELWPNLQLQLNS